MPSVARAPFGGAVTSAVKPWGASPTLMHEWGVLQDFNHLNGFRFASHRQDGLLAEQKVDP
jgi:hypothetical protein